ncbi:MAG: ATP-binding protein [Coriobacteriales bacterium]|nr:ATP-binding protein [Coriobacteriales bacterium]
MAQDFYPFVDNGNQLPEEGGVVSHPARIAVYDDAAAAPRVVVVEPKDVRSYLEEITLQVTQLAQQQGSTIPFMVIREIVENFIHAYFLEPTISILDHGCTIRFSDQGPGIREKERALQYGTSSATEEMRHYIRGVGSGLPYAQQYMKDKGGSLTISDNMSGGTIVTLSTKSADKIAAQTSNEMPAQPQTYGQQVPYQGFYQQPQQMSPAGWQQPYAAGGYPAPQMPYQWPQQMPASPTMPWPQGAQQAPGWPQTQQAVPTQPGWGTPAGTYPPQVPQPQAAPAAPPAKNVSEMPVISPRGLCVLEYLSEHDVVGPSELAREYGDSLPTWTRELKVLQDQGLLRKDGQKRRLTALGQAYLSGLGNI